MSIKEMATISSEEYFDLLRKTSSVAVEFIEGGLKKYQYNTHLYDLVTTLVERRRKKPSVRAAMVRFAFEAAGGKDWKKVIPLAAAAELEMISLYHLNHLWDKKGGESAGDLYEQTIAAALTRGAALELFSDSVRENTDAVKLISSFEKIDARAHEGVYIDLLQLNWSALELPVSKLLELYEKRCELMNGELFAISAEIAARIAGADAEEQKNLSEIGKCYGTVGQMINDIGDWVPPEKSGETVGKISDDSWSDLRNGRLTLPIIFGWNSGSVEIKKLLNKAKNGQLLPEEMLLLSKKMVEEGIFTKCQKKIQDRVQQSIGAIKKIPSNSPLINMFVGSEENRYFSALDKLSMIRNS